MNEPTTTVIGNLTSDVDLRFTQAGTAVANFTLACNPQRFDKTAGTWVDAPPLFLRCTVWRHAAENLAECLRRGDRVIATGQLQQRSYETRDGDKRTTIELTVTEVGASLHFAQVKLTRVEREAAPATDGDEPPF